MTEFDSATLESVVTDDCTDLEERDVRALVEKMTVLSEDGDDLHKVVTESGRQYTVDRRHGRCNCPDFEYRGATCKHIRRVKYAIGEVAIPEWTDSDALDSLLGEHVEASPRVAATDGGGVIVAGDDAEILDEGESEEDGRPDKCKCGNWNADNGLSCFPCYREGFEKPASAD